LEQPLSNTRKLSWTEADLSELIGQSESIRREFKSGRMFDDETDKWIATVSKEVSALANTEGGELFLGIDEDKKSKPRIASSIDGAPAALAPERLQDLIEGNLNPYLPGIRVQRVMLSSPPSRVVFVILIPPGSTAYQANDGRYYGRSEFGAKHLPDHEIRLRMNRGKVARGSVLAGRVSVDLGIEQEKRVSAEITRRRALRAQNGDIEQLEVERRNADGIIVFRSDALDAMDLLSARTVPDQISIDFVFRNDGELTIRSPALEFREIRNGRLFDEGLVQVTAAISRPKLEGAIIYPGDVLNINAAHLSLICKREALLASGDYTLSWKIFLDNSSPSFGDIDLAILIEAERNKRRVAAGL
jgi:Putative DNA-binding domain